MTELEALRAFVDAVRFASCDSHSGEYCEDGSCANRVIPLALAKLRKECATQ